MSLGYVSYNGVPVSTETPLGKHLLTWERKSDYRPENNPYPRMLYKAVKGGDGIVRCLEDEPSPYLYQNMGLHQQAIDRVRVINESRVMTVGTEEEHKKARENGWRDSAQEAIDAIHGYEHDMQVAAAEMAYRDRNMSEPAKREVLAYAATTTEQVVTMPEARTVKEHWKTRQKREKDAAKAVA